MPDAGGKQPLWTQVQDAGLTALAGAIIRRVAVRLPPFPADSHIRYWLMKSEPDGKLHRRSGAAPGQRLPWFGVPQLPGAQFRKTPCRSVTWHFLSFQLCQPGIAGICRVCSEPYPDETQFAAVNPISTKSARDNPRWWLRDVLRIQNPLAHPGRITRLPELTGMRLLARRHHLSIMPVSSGVAVHHQGPCWAWINSKVK